MHGPTSPPPPPPAPARQARRRSLPPRTSRGAMTPPARRPAAVRIAAAGFLASRRPRRRPAVEARKTTHGPVHTAHPTPARAARGPLSRQARPSPSLSQKPPLRPRLASHQSPKNRQPFLGLPGHWVSISKTFFRRNFRRSISLFARTAGGRASRCSLSALLSLSPLSPPRLGHAPAYPPCILQARRGARPLVGAV